MMTFKLTIMTQATRVAGNDSVEVFQYVLKGYFFLH